MQNKSFLNEKGPNKALDIINNKYKKRIKASE